MTFNFSTLKLKILIKISRQIPKNRKNHLIKLLISKKEAKSFNETKYLFSHQTFLDSYDLLTSSILALHYNNFLSLEILNRAQLETYLFTYFLSKNPDQIKNVFSEEVYSSKRYLSFIKKDGDKIISAFKNYYNQFYSKKAHPVPTRFMSDIKFYSFMKPKVGNLDFDILMNKRRRKEFNLLDANERINKLKELFEVTGLSPGISIKPHTSRETKEYLCLHMIYFYISILDNLKTIEKNCQDFKMGKEDWERAIRKYKKD